MATVTNPNSVGKVELIDIFRERIARSWDKFGASNKPDALHLANRVIAQEFRDGQHDPKPLVMRHFNLRFERYEG